VQRLRAELESLRLAHENRTLVPEVMASVRQAEERLARELAERATEESERRRARIESMRAQLLAVPATATLGDRLDAALRERLAVLAQRHPGVLAEDKGSSFALHYRAVPEVAPALAAALDELLAGPLGRGLRLLPGKMVFEVIGRGCDKGLAIRRFLAAPPFRGRWPLFIGDDVTDEAALAVVAELGGLGLSVGRALPGARAVFADAAALRAALVEAAGGLAR